MSSLQNEGFEKYTFTIKNGSSVIDLCTVSVDLLGNVANFTVGKEIWSDHFPIVLKISGEGILATEAEKINLVPKLIWKNKNTLHYIK